MQKSVFVVADVYKGSIVALHDFLYYTQIDISDGKLVLRLIKVILNQPFVLYEGYSITFLCGTDI